MAMPPRRDSSVAGLVEAMHNLPRRLAARFGGGDGQSELNNRAPKRQGLIGEIDWGTDTSAWASEDDMLDNFRDASGELATGFVLADLLSKQPKSKKKRFFI